MKIKLGNSLLSNKEIGFDFQQHMHDGHAANMIMLGNSGSGKTHAIKNIIKQYIKNTDTNVIIISDHIYEYDDIECNNKYSKDYSVDIDEEFSYNISHLINRGYLKGKFTLLIIDCAYIQNNDKLLYLLVNTSIISRMHNCMVISTFIKPDDIPGQLAMSTNMFQVFKLCKSDIVYGKNINKYRLFGISKLTHDMIKNFKQGEHILNIDGHRVPIGSDNE